MFLKNAVENVYSNAQKLLLNGLRKEDETSR